MNSRNLAAVGKIPIIAQCNSQHSSLLLLLLFNMQFNKLIENCGILELLFFFKGLKCNSLSLIILLFCCSHFIQGEKKKLLLKMKMKASMFQ